MSPSPSHTGADRNLLVGILALQMNFVTRDQLVAGMQAWVFDKAKPLGQVLLEQGALRGDIHTLLEALVQTHLDLHGNDAEKSLAAVSSVGSVRQELQQIADPDLQASLVRVSAARHGDEDPYGTKAPSVGTPTSTGLRFRILRPHAKGGLGQVSVAHDEELGREVALKEIQDRYADDQGSRSRFLLEAEITGGLEHPGIVPVYGLGTYSDGRPFYAMRFIRGDSLKDAVERFHKMDVSGRDPGERTLELRKLLGGFVDVCNAIAYAHSRGVLHRDLKPGNIMLGQYGETLVVDWGLAKPVGRLKGDGRSAEGPLHPASASGSAPTQMGSAIGTPQYMSPEQAAGKLDQLGAASDVYSLGATLYCLLTGKAPLEGHDVGEVLRKVQRGEVPPPRHAKHTVAPALEAICLKAMGLKPEDRYTSPRALADDVEHWLADEPVAAYAEPWTARLGRWLRQHKALAGTGAAVGAVVATVVIASVLVAAASQREGQARTRADEQHRAAQQMDRLRGLAVEQRGQAQQQRALAEEQRALARRYQYLADMNVAGRAWQEGNVRSVQSTLDRYVAPPAPEDVRGFEYHYLRRLVHSDLMTLRGHSAAVLGVAFSPDGKSLASAGADRTVRLWHAADGAAGNVLKEHGANVHCVAFSADGRWLASGGANGEVCMRDLAAGKSVFLQTHAGAVIDLAFGPGDRVASASRDKTVKVWHIGTGPARFILRHWDEVLAVTFNADGKWLASGELNGQVTVWDGEKGKEVHRLFGAHTDAVSAVAFTADGRWLISGSWDQTIKVWDTGTWKEVYVLKGHRGPVNALALSPDGSRLASAGWD